MKVIYRSQILTLFYQIMVFNAILNSSQFSKIPYFSLLTRVLLLALVSAGILIWLLGKRRVNKLLIVVSAVLIAVSFIAMRKSNSQIAIIMLLYLMIFYKDLEPRTFCKKYVEAATLAMLLVISLCIAGVFPNEYRYRILSSGMTQYRYYLGFITTTASANFAFHISLAYLFYKQERFGLKDSLLLIIPNTILYALTNTRAAYFEVLFAILLFWLLKIMKGDWLKKVIGFLSIWLMPFFACIELYVVNNYTATNPFYAMLDAALSHRLNWAVKAIKSYPIGLFGNNITWEATSYTETSQLVDMFYIRCAIQYGVIFLVLIIIGFMGMSVYFQSRGNYYGCVIIIALALHSITDPQLLEYSCIPLFILFLTGYKTIFDSLLFGKKRKRMHRIRIIY